ncbi:MAG: hypothetical protein ACYTHM_09310 [Planctomycetota bacterium]
MTADGSGKPVEAPIKRIVLYKHGIGFFERKTQVKDDGAVDLKFKQKEMNDVLKSLTVLDLGGGTVSSISYDATTPLDKLLEEVAINIPDRGSVSSLLSQVKGALLEIKVGSEVIRGKVVGLDESVERGPGECTLTRVFLSLLDDEGRIRANNLADIEYITFLDEHIRKDLVYLLNTIIASYRKDVKNITVFVSGPGEREIAINYVIETPVWKTAYRAVLGGEDTAPYIQGWALVDNTGDEDWDRVSLSLVSGLPVSFVHDLYSPRFIRRPVVHVETEASVSPVFMEEPDADWDDEDLDTFAESEKRKAPASPSRTARVAKPSSAASGPLGDRALADVMEDSVRIQTVSREIGDFFEYRIENPVTVRRNQSALVPIISGPFEGRKVLLYNQANRPENPMACIEFKNTTGLTLEGGPMTVLDSGIYAGEAMVDTLKPDDDRLIPFAVELGTRVNPEYDSQVEDVHFVKIYRGVMTLHSRRIHVQTYRIHNKSKGAKVLYIEHPITRDQELFDTPDPVEKTPSFYRFKLNLAGKASIAFTVKERSAEHQVIQVASLSSDQIRFYLAKKYITAAVAGAFGEIADLQVRLSTLQGRRQEKEETLSRIAGDQDRLRQNIRALSTSPDERKLRERYTKKLESQEDRIEKLEGEIDALKMEESHLEHSLAEKIEGFSFEQTLS